MTVFFLGGGGVKRVALGGAEVVCVCEDISMRAAVKKKYIYIYIYMCVYVCMYVCVVPGL
jgi:hypothetical protein